MYSNIIITLINVLLFLYKDKSKNDNEYTKEKKYYYQEKEKKIIKIANIFNVIINVIAIIIMLLNSIKLDIIYIITLMIYLISFIIISLKKEHKKRLKIINKKYITISDIAIILSSIIFIIACHTNIANNNGLLFVALGLILILIYIGFLIYIIIKEKKYTCYNSSEEDYFLDIKFTKKIELNKTVNYVIYIFTTILFVLIKIPYMFILYILVEILLIYIINKKYKKIINQSDKLYKKISIANESPGIVYAFQFVKDILLFKKLIILLIIYSLSILSMYIVGESAFVLISSGLYLLLLYNIIIDKKYLIRYIMSLNKELIDKKSYTIDITKKINYIDKIKFFKITLYKIIIQDNINYESNIILYDPELIIEELNIKINKSNLEDYITIENILYEEE